MLEEETACSSERHDLPSLVQRFGGPTSTALLDPECAVFRVHGLDGAIGYRLRVACAVSIGDPVCKERDAPVMAEAFRQHCVAHGWRTAYAVASKRFTHWAITEGYGAIEFGEELLFDPRRDPTAGPAGRELRKKIFRAHREGVEVHEYRPLVDGRDAALERAMEDVADAWLAMRHGPQMYVATMNLFGLIEGRRWFYTQNRGRITGVLATIRLDAMGGHLLDHHLIAPDAAIGTSEALVAEALRAFGAEGSAWVTFGPAPAREIGAIEGLGVLSSRITRAIYHTTNQALGLDTRSRYRRKFQVARTEPAFLLVSPRRVGVREAVSFMSAFHLSFV